MWVETAQKQGLAGLAPQQVVRDTVAGDPVTQVGSRTPSNDAAIGGSKVESAGGWAAVRPSGTEDIYKIYAESFIDTGHLRRILNEAQTIVDRANATPADAGDERSPSKEH